MNIDTHEMLTFGPLEVKESNPKDLIGIRKAPMSVVSGAVMAEIGVAMLEGASKYGRHNYRAAGVRASVYYDATMRHLMGWWEGEDIDMDSGLSHVTKAIASLVALRDDWNVVANALNLAEALAGLQVGHNLTAKIAAGQGALLTIARRMIGGSATCYASELADVDEAIFVYRAQMKVCTQGDFSRACERVKVLHRSGSMQDVADMFDLMPRAA